MNEIIEIVEKTYGSGAAIAVADLLKEYEEYNEDEQQECDIPRVYSFQQ